MNNVRIADKGIYINGQLVGRIEGSRSEVWLMAYPNYPTPERGKFIARFKYAKPGTKAREFIKAVFSRVGMEEYLGLLPVLGSPMHVAWAIGAADESRPGTFNGAAK